MQRYESFELEAPASDTSGASKNIEKYGKCCVQISGTFSATVHVEVSLDGSTWVSIHTATAPELYALPDVAIQSIRIRTASFVSGDPVARFAGVNRQTTA